MSEEREAFKRISAADFLNLDFSEVTLVDLREDDERIIDSIPGAIAVPFSSFATKLDDIPKDKPVYVYCGHGDFSEEIAEILADRGYDVTNVDGGYAEIRKIKAAAGAEEKESDKKATPTVRDAAEKTAGEPVIEIDAKGLKCPGPIVKVGDTLRSHPQGTRFHVQATEDAFCSDIKVWCDRTGNKLEKLTVADGIINAYLTRTDGEKKPVSSGHSVRASEVPHGKNFVVFDDDLDKVIAAFIMANGAAAMGRPVTMFFTFWGLNVLRKPGKVKVPKNFVEKMFGAMMPRGTKKLPLSHMNMFGAGPKMIRAIMKQHGISSLEELIQSALDHGVRIIVCQMSMEIMGIKKEELYDGLEYGGVSTFLGNAELSDMSLFI